MLSTIKRFFIIIVTFAGVWAAGFGWFVSQIPTSPVQDKALTDAIVVLTGGSLRLEHGLSLLVDEKAPVLFVSGVKKDVSLSDLLHGKEVTQIASQVPQERVELGHNAHSTFENAQETKIWASNRAIKSIRLITGNYHMPRSIFVFQQALPGVALIADPVFPAEFSTNSWWLTESSLKLVVSEYHKYMATRLSVMLGIITEE